MNVIYQLLKTMINSNKYNKKELADKVDVFFAMGRITQEQYIELVEELTPPKPLEEPKKEVVEETATPNEEKTTEKQ